MYYFICFFVALLILLWAVAINENIRLNQILLIAVVVAGDGGYYALVEANSLETAILANKLTYLIGVFAPMLIFFCICEICKIELKRIFVVSMYVVQIVLYLCVCTIGKYDIFYKTAELHKENGRAFLTKTYGPVHGVYVALLVLYLCLWVGAFAFSFNKRKNSVSTKTVDILIFTCILITGAYMIERGIHLKLELMPFAITIGLIAILIAITRVSRYSIEENKKLIEDQLEGTAYIVFSKRLNYMGCNEYAARFFPELAEWELEKRIPGNGGRFNTFLRQTFMKCVKEDQELPVKGNPFTIKDRRFSYVIKHFYNGKKQIGFLIELQDITTFAEDLA